ncbi:branched-chain amino acid ABC transporter permease [Streptomyces sp. RKND-216]|uniref:branched-chain amino acid ABC transporter permease n=1 Tax=Streptomyces sp. RKND-216 TaxID=2562581 RepID=UPI00109DF852|nr:ABC transporter permease [Streptomyces sp. RKND-216]THA25397.1 branched-chain amino acid ABC transporter permease [Streptomyces sp. RKND-216]
MGALDAHLVPAFDGVAYGLLLFVVAAGLSLAFGTAGVLNLAHGWLYAIGAYAGAALSDGSWAGLAAGLAAGTAIACAAGALLALATAPLARRGHLDQALLTFGLALIGGNVLIEVFGADEQPVHVPDALNTSVSLLGHRYPAYRLGFIVAAVLLAAAGSWVLRGTRAGAAVRAAADDPDMLAAGGRNPRTVHAAVLTVSGALAGAAGVLGAPIIGPGPGTGDTVLMLSLIVVVLGGLDSLWKTLLAAVAVGQVQTLGVSLVPDLAPYLLFAAMALVLVLRSRSAVAEPPPAPVPAATGRVRKAVRERFRRPGGLPRGLRRLTRPAPPAQRATGLLALSAALGALPWLLDDYSLSLAGHALALGLLAASVTVLTGWAGLPTLGQTAPFAVGAYATALLADAGWTVGPVQVAVAATAAALFALVVGPAVIRARGTTVLMITLAIGELTHTAVGGLTSVTGGTDGLVGFPSTEVWWGAGAPENEATVYWYTLAVAACALAVTLIVLRSPAGMLLTGSRAAEARMRASGHPVDRYLTAAHVGAGALAGVAGSLLVTGRQYVSPADVGFEIAAFALLAAVVGGTVSVVGAVFGAGLIVATRDWLSGIWPGYGPALLGVLFVVTVYLLPRGLPGLFAARSPGAPARKATS